MRKTFIAAAFAATATACMSDAKCDEDFCCYMNACMPIDSVECLPGRMDLFKALNAANMTNKADVKNVVESMRTQFDVEECDSMHDRCIDYIGIMAEQLKESPPDQALSFAAKMQEDQGATREQKRKVEDDWRSTLVIAGCGIGVVVCLQIYGIYSTTSPKKKEITRTLLEKEN